MKSAFAGAVIIVFAVIFAGIVLEHTAQGVLLSTAVMPFFLNLPGLLITLGGTVAVLAASFPLRFLGRVPAHLAIIMRGRRYDPVFYAGILTELSHEARGSGLFTLEESARGFDKDNFLHDAIALAADGVGSEYIRAILQYELSCLKTRHAQNWEFYDKAASSAPVFGIIGTLAGIVGMLASLASGQNMAGVFAAMATALSATLYGIILGSAVFAPIASRLRIIHQEEILCKELIVVGVLSIAAGEKPRFIEKKLLSFLEPSRRREKNVETQ
jgi:chemotaxis protein MotA